MRRAALLFLALAASAFAEKKVLVPEGGRAGVNPYSAGIQTEHFVYVSGHVGPSPGGKFAPFDIKEQTRQCLRLVGNVLKAAGLSHRHIVSTTLYLTDIRTLDAADEAYREYFPGPLYPARTDLESQLLIPEALVEISAVAYRGDPDSVIHLSPDGWAKSKRPYDHAVVARDTLFFSGLRPIDMATGALAGSTIQEQTERVMRNQEAVLAAAGMKFADLAATRIYLTEPADYAGLNDVYRKFVAAPPPARATINTHAADLGHLVQMQSVAVRGSGDGRPSGEGITSPIHSYSVRAGNRLYITGMTGRRPDGGVARGDIKAQTRQALRTIEEQLKRHGMTFADCVDAVVWIRDPRYAAGMNEAYREIVQPNPPARATVRVAPNGAEGLVEIMMIAEK